MKKLLQKLFRLGLVFVYLDVFIVIFAFLQVASGVDIPHIVFWDAQMRFIVNLFG